MGSEVDPTAAPAAPAQNLMDDNEFAWSDIQTNLNSIYFSNILI
jgi:hypothetical protein